MMSLAFLLVILHAIVLVSQSQGACDHVSVQYGTVRYEYSHYVVSCDPGYVSQESRIVYCVRNEWERSPPICSLADNANPCANVGECKHICKNDHGRARCRCRRGYTLESDGKSCIETPAESDEQKTNPESSHISVLHQNPQIAYSGSQHGTAVADEKSSSSDSNDPCHKHECAQLCRNEEGRAQCRCNRGFLLNKDQRSCDKNMGPPVYPQYPCETNNGGCEHKCHNRKLNQVACSCPSGYLLAEDKKRCIAVPSVPRPVSCSFDNGGCQGHCVMRGYTVVCSCPPGYSLDADGKNCIVRISSWPSCDVDNGGCRHGCSMRGNSVLCSCPAGYRLDTDLKNCVVAPIRRPSCDVDNGGCQHGCSMRGNSVVCSCPAGYRLDTDRKNCVGKCPAGYRLDTDRKNCVDIDECRFERLNKCHHICENIEGSYICHCRPGYVMIENKCEGCRKNSYWSTEKNGCVDCPANSFTISEGKTTVRDCFCNPGFTGNPGENIPCLDIDECSSHNFGCSHTCVNTPGEVFCSCPLGYHVDKDNKTCIDIDECSIKNGGCEGLCYNTEGSFSCKCSPGFVQSNKDQYSCDDVDECSENNGGCHQLCINYRGGHYCACKDGYRIDGSLKNCSDITCPPLPVPHFSTMRCKRDLQVLQEMDNYPTGTVCSFKCISGFKDASQSNRMKCLEDGTWEGSFAECKSQRCPSLRVPENGDVHPASCATEGNTVKQKCTFTCRQGYKLMGPSIFSCKNNLSWERPMDSLPVCQPEDIRASMECTREITATLLPGESRQNVSIPEPVTNMESYEVLPNDTVVGKPTEFPAGKTKVLFTASSPSSSRTAKCLTTVHVIDMESPVFISCPEDILIEDARLDGEIVSWIEPEVTDNVEVESVSSSVSPNTTLAPGSYVVEYVARDAAGNTNSCSFKIDVKRLSCDDLDHPVHGDANCMDWMYGRLCQPLCDDGYLRDPSEVLFYSCGDSRVWEPSDKISDCLPYAEFESSQCPDGMEYKYIEETDEEICLQCPSSAVWSSTTLKCEDATT